MVDFDRAISAIAARPCQGGHITLRQLTELGVSRNGLRHRVARGLLIAVFQGVYAVGHLPTNPIDRAKGALLAAGPRSAISHGSAGTIWGVYDYWSNPLELIVVGNRHPRGLIIHRSTKLVLSDIQDYHGVRVVSPALAVMQLAPRMTEKRLKWVIDSLRLQHRLSLDGLHALIRRQPRHPGAPYLRAALELVQHEPARSPWEIEWPPFAQKYELPQYATNTHVCGHRTDVYFEPEGVIVELDGWETHQTRKAFEDDREIPAEILAKTGIVTVRITRRQFRRRPAEQAERLHTILAQRREERAA
jgi:very-short-patch-repair endonuclease